MERPINLWCPRSKVKVKLKFLAITFVLFGVHTSNLSHIVAYGKANKSLMSKVKGQGQNKIFGHNFCSAWCTYFQLVSYCSLWKANRFLTSKVKDEGQGHVKGQNKIFGHNFGSIGRTDIQLVSYWCLWKGESCQRSRRSKITWRSKVISRSNIISMLKVTLMSKDTQMSMVT